NVEKVHVDVGKHQTVKGTWTKKERLKHINIKELMAVQRVLKHFKDELRARDIHLLSDSMVVVNILEKWSSSSPSLMRVLRELWNWLDSQLMTIYPQYIKSEDNVIADYLSRERLPVDSMLDPKQFQELDKRFGPYSIDLFADRHNNQVSRYFSVKVDKEALGVSAFSRPLSKKEVYWAYPPFRLLPKLLEFLEGSEAKLTLLTPFCPGTQWYWELTKMAGVVEEYHPRFLKGKHLPYWEVNPKRKWRIMHFLGSMGP
ncbi:MAG: reverse transcriptase-like protein, partial [Bacteroidota bacterium]